METKAEHTALRERREGRKKKSGNWRDLDGNDKSQRAAERKSRGGEKEGRRGFADDLVENVMQHAALSQRQPGARPGDLQSSRVTCHVAGGQIHINICISSKLVSKSELAALMCMNESLSAFETVCVCVYQGEGSGETDREEVGGCIN